MKGLEMRIPVQFVRGVLVVLAVIMLLLAVGYFFQMTWATSTWPWQDGRLSFIFLSSILAAIAAPVIWVTVTREFAALAGSAMFPLLASAGMGIYLIQKYSTTTEPTFLLQIIAMVAAVVFSIGVMIWGRSFQLRDKTPMPPLVRGSFVAFAAVLILAGGLLIFKVPHIMPWSVSEDTGVMFGWIFLGAATGYIFGAVYPFWNYARGPLLGFLIYDLVLGPPLIGNYANIQPDYQLSFMIYSVVVIYSTILAAYFLFFYPATRSWKLQAA
jgi:hypothetical protein